MNRKTGSSGRKRAAGGTDAHTRSITSPAVAAPAEPPLRAVDVPLTVGTIVRLERVIGSQALAELERNQQVNITMEQKQRLLVEVLGYGEEDAAAAPIEQLEDELSCFFLRWLIAFETARLRSERTLLLNTQSLVRKARV